MDGLKLRKLRISKPAAVSLHEQNEDGDPVTPASRIFIQPDFYTVVLCLLGFERPIQLPLFKQEVLNTIAKHPRFSSIMKLGKNGKGTWKKTHVNIDDHVKVVELTPQELESPNFIEEYIAKLADAEPFDMSRPLWEIHVLNYKTEDAASVCILRFHHAVGDGTSVMSLFLASTRQLEYPNLLPSIPGSNGVSYPGLLAKLWKYLLVIWYSVVEIWKFSQMQLLQADSNTRLKSRRGAENWPKSFAIVSFTLDEMKLVKKAAESTINDVLLAVIANGIRLYLEHHSGGENLEKLRVRALLMKNTRPSPGLQELAEMMKGSQSKARWGNNMGYLLIPLSLQKFDDSLEYVRRAKACSIRKKHSLEADFTYASGALLVKLFGPKVGVDITYKSTLQTTVTVSNMMGPKETVTFAGNPINYIVPTSNGLPQAFLIHMTSYRGEVKIGLIAKNDIIPDLHFLAKCFKDAMQELKLATNS